MTERPNGSAPGWGESIVPPEPDFIADKPEPNTFEETVREHENRKKDKETLAKIREESKKKPGEPIETKPFKIGSLDTNDIFQSDPDYKPQRPLSAKELNSIDARLKGPWKDLPDLEKKKKIREYMRQQDKLDQAS